MARVRTEYVSAYTIETAKAMGPMRQLDAQLGKGSASAGGFAKSLLGIGGAVAGLWLAHKAISSIGDSLAAWGVQEKAIKQVEAALKSTGGASGYTSRELQDLASSLQKVTLFGDEVTLMASAQLLTFTNINKDVFPKTIELAQDIATRMGTDLRSAVIQVGKAMNDLEGKGLDGLNRAGVQFTDTQKDMIKAHFAAGDAAAGQAIILAELETQFGGSARAAREGTGAFQAMGNAAGDLSEAVGRRLSVALAEAAEELIPVIEGITRWLNRDERLREALALSGPAVRQWKEGVDSTEEPVKKMTARVEQLTLAILELEAEQIRAQSFGLLGEWTEASAARVKNVTESLERLRAKLVDQIDEEAGINPALAQIQLAEAGLRSTAAALKEVAEGVAEVAAEVRSLAAEDVVDLPLSHLTGNLDTTAEQARARQEAEAAQAAAAAAAEKAKEDEEAAALAAAERAEMWRSIADSAGQAADLFFDMNSSTGDMLGNLAQAGAVMAQMRADGKGWGEAITGALAVLGQSGALGRTGGAIAQGAAAGAEFGAWGIAIGATVGAITDMLHRTEQGFVDAGVEAEGVRRNIAEGAMSSEVDGVLDVIAQTFDDILSSLGGHVTRFTQLGILWRKDSEGLRVAIDGVWTSFGDDVEAALNFAVTELVRLSEIQGIGPEAEAALRNFAGNTIDELHETVALALRLEAGRLGPEVAGVTASIRGIFADIFAGIAAGIPIEGGLANLERVWDQISGVQLSREEIYEREKEALLLQLDLAEVQLRAELAALEAKGQIVQTEARILQEDLDVKGRYVQGLAGITGASVEMLAIIGDALARIGDLRERIEGATVPSFGGGGGFDAGAASRQAEADQRQRALRELAILEELAAGHDDVAEAMRREDEILALVESGLTRVEAERRLELLAILDSAAAAEAAAEAWMDTVAVLRETVDELLRPDDFAAQIDRILAPYAEARRAISDAVMDQAGLSGLDRIREMLESGADLSEFAAIFGDQIAQMVADLLALGERATQELQAFAGGFVADIIEQELQRHVAEAVTAEQRLAAEHELAEFQRDRQAIERALQLANLAYLETALIAAGAMTDAMQAAIDRAQDLLGEKPGAGGKPGVGDRWPPQGADEGAALRRELAILEQLAAGHIVVAEAMEREDEILALVAQGLTELEAARYLDLQATIAARDALRELERLEALAGGHDALVAAMDREDRILALVARGLSEAQAARYLELEAILETRRAAEEAQLEHERMIAEARQAAADAARAAADQLGRLRDELAGIVETSEASQLGPAQRALDGIFDTFARAGSILHALSASGAEWERTARAMASELSGFWRGLIVDPAQQRLDALRAKRQSPAQQFQSARAAFQGLDLSDLSDLSPDDAARIFEVLDRFQAAGTAQFGEGFGASVVGRQVEAALEQLIGQVPNEQDLLLEAIEYLESQTSTKLDTLATGLGPAGTLAVALTGETGVAASLIALADKVDDPAVAGGLTDLANALTAGEIGLDDAALLAGLVALEKGLNQDSSIVAELDALENALVAGVTLDSTTLANTLDALAGTLDDETIADGLGAIADQLRDGTLSIDDVDLLDRLGLVRDALGGGHPLYNVLDAVWRQLNPRGHIAAALADAIASGDVSGVAAALSALAGSIESETGLAGGIEAIADLLAGEDGSSAADMLRSIASELLDGTLTMDSGSLKDRLGEVLAALGGDHPLYNALDAIWRNLGGTNRPGGYNPLSAIYYQLDPLVSHSTGWWVSKIYDRLGGGADGALHYRLGQIYNRLGSVGQYDTTNNYLWHIYDRLGGGPDGVLYHKMEQVRSVMAEIKDGLGINSPASNWNAGGT